MTDEIEEVRELVVFGVQCLEGYGCSDLYSSGELSTAADTYCKGGENDVQGDWYECGVTKKKE